MTGEGGMGAMNVADGDKNVHGGKRSNMLFEENTVGFEECPYGSFDGVEGVIGSDFETTNR